MRNYYRQTPTGWERDATPTESSFHWVPINFNRLPKDTRRKLSILALVQVPEHDEQEVAGIGRVTGTPHHGVVLRIER